MKTQAGFSLVEIILAIALFGFFTTGIIGAIIYGRESSVLSGTRTSAIFLAEEGLEAVRTIRDENYANLADGTYGISATGNKWNLSGASDTSSIFTRKVAVSTIDTNTKQVTSTVTWPQNLQRTGTVSVVTYFTNQTPPPPASSSLTLIILGASLSSDKKTLQGISLKNTGTDPIVVTKISVGWTPNLLGRKTQTLTLGGTSVWTSGGVGTPTGLQNPGTTFTILPYTIAPGATASFTALFNGINGSNIFTVVFTLSDGSTQTVITSLLL